MSSTVDMTDDAALKAALDVAADPADIGDLIKFGRALLEAREAKDRAVDLATRTIDTISKERDEAREERDAAKIQYHGARENKREAIKERDEARRERDEAATGAVFILDETRRANRGEAEAAALLGRLTPNAVDRYLRSLIWHDVTEDERALADGNVRAFAASIDVSTPLAAAAQRVIECAERLVVLRDDPKTTPKQMADIHKDIMKAVDALRKARK